MSFRLTLRVAVTLLAVIYLPAAALPRPADVESPGSYLGFGIGEDRKLADYKEVTGYLESLAAASPRVEIREIGRTTMGKPFIMAVLSTPENLRNLERYVEISRRLADPRGLSPEEAGTLADRCKVLVMITCNLHSTEIASSQAALELAYKIAAGLDPTLDKALEETVLFLIPSLNPDGQQMVVDWYEKWEGTEYEGCPLPRLYHNYAGHDNNRDWFMANLAETRAVFDLYFRDVVPHVILDMHQMMTSGARLFLPPFFPPANANVDPILYREIALLGSFMQLACEEKGYAGVVSNAYFTAYWEGTSMMTPWWHNQVGLLSEAASANIASPVYVEEEELRGGAKGLPRYEHRVNFPNPWPGGWWRLRDIVDYELAICEGLIECCALHRARLLGNFHLMGRKAVEKGKSEPPFGFVLPAPHRDPVTAARLVEALMLGGVDVHRASSDFEIGERLYREGSFVVRCDQPYRAYAKDLMEIQHYPDIRASKKEPFVRPYDITGWTLPMQMGIPCETIDHPFAAALELLREPPYPEHVVPVGSHWGYLLRPERNESYHAVNILLESGIEVYRADESISIDSGTGRPGARRIGVPHDGKVKMVTKELVRRPDVGGVPAIPPGAFIIPTQKGLKALTRKLGDTLHAEFLPLEEEPEAPRRALRPTKVALFKPWRASMDEGWTRYLFDSYDVPYENVTNDDIKKGRFGKYDLLLLPDVRPSIIKDGKPAGEWAKYARPLPPEYSGGIGKEGIEEIKKFVDRGGTLVCFDSSCELALEVFELPVQSALKDAKRDDFYCPGSILSVRFKKGHPITYGMPEEGYLFFADSPAFMTSPPFGKVDRKILASYSEKEPLASGLLKGGEYLYRKAALVALTYGKGKIVLFGFRPQHRCQTHGTYKLIFNTLLESLSNPVTG